MRSRHHALVLVAVFLAVLSLSCTLTSATPAPGQGTSQPAQGTESTKTLTGQTERPMQAVRPTTTAAAIPTPSPTSTAPGSISGKLSYPASAIPPLRIVAFNIETGLVYSNDVRENTSTYRIGSLPPGTYHVVAYVASTAPRGFPVGLSAGYTQAVLCGLTASCKDHTLLAVLVEPGVEKTGIDPQDWYAPEGAFPSMP